MDQQRAVIIGISGCSSSGKTTLARLLRDLFPETFILHEDDFYKPESELPTKNGFLDWDCPEAISIPDLHAALSHVRATGTFPVSSSSSSSAPTRRLSQRSDHGCAPLPFHAPSPALSSSFPSVSYTCPLSPPTLSSSSSSTSSLSSSSPTSSLTTTAAPRAPRAQPQPTVTSKEDLNSVGACPATPAQIAACAAKVREWLSPGQPGSLIFPCHNRDHATTTDNNNENNEDKDNNEKPKQPKQPSLRICLLDGFLLYSPPHLRPIMAQLDVKLLLRASRARAVARRAARDGYVTLEGFWKDPPGYVEKVVWPNYVDSHGWLFEGGKVDGGRLDGAVLAREGIEVLDPSADGEDAEFGRVLEWAVEAVMRGLERVVLKGERAVDGDAVDWR